MSKKLVGGLLGMALVGTMLVGQAGASGTKGSTSSPPPHVSVKAGGDSRDLPRFVQKWQNQKIAATDAVARGEARVRKDGTVKLPNREFVDYELEGEDHIITILADFTKPNAGKIKRPDREVDNATYWEKDFDRHHYQDMLFSEDGGYKARESSFKYASMRDLYLEMSDGRYAVNGQVSKWVRINKPESEFGGNGPDGPGSDNANGPTYRVIRAALNATEDRKVGIKWSKADEWDRYDCDLDDNFDEPDGYVDHFQLIHAGQGEEEGGGAEGGKAIWSHRSYAAPGGYGTKGPSGFPETCLQGGYKVPGKNLWVGDYTTSPENGGVGVFAHEFGHDLGLPDLYDTTYIGESAVEFWSLMGGGGWAAKDPKAIGMRPTHMDAWSKMVLGWIQGDDLATVDYDPESPPAEPQTFDLGPGEGATPGRKQVIQVNLPDYEYTVELDAAPEGSDPFYYYSDTGDDVETTMSRELSAPLATNTKMTFRSWYDIEEDWDYAYVEATSDGTTWAPLDGNLSTEKNPNGQNDGHGITGTSGAWVDGAYTIPAGTTAVRIRYWTDGVYSLPGFIVDSISLPGEIEDDGSGAADWTLDGFLQVENGEIFGTASHHYLIESRSYLRNDVSLQGAYNFIEGNWLEKTPFADGVLIWYRDGRWEDNNVGMHPGHGQILPVDSHPELAVRPDGDFWRTRWQTWDSTFGNTTHEATLTQVMGGDWVTTTYTAEPVNVFNDSSPTAYYNADKPDMGTMTAGSGLKVTIQGDGTDGNYTIVIE